MSKKDIKTNVPESPNRVYNGLCEVNGNAIDTWLEPYIGWKFKVLRKRGTTTIVEWFGENKIIDNAKLNFA